MIINDSNGKRGVTRGQRRERHLEVAACEGVVLTFRDVGGLWCHSTYFPRAKHSNLTVTPLAASTVWGKCASILGSYSPMTPRQQKHTHTSKWKDPTLCPVGADSMENRKWHFQMHAQIAFCCLQAHGCHGDRCDFSRRLFQWYLSRILCEVFWKMIV